MEVQAALYKPGTRVFVSNPKRGSNQPEYVVATVVERANDGQISCEIPNGSKQLRVMKPLTEVPLCEKQEAYLGDKMSDEFQFPSEPSIVESLKSRFNKEQFFTTAGATLVAVNPFKAPATEGGGHLYDQAYMAQVRRRVPDGELSGQSRAKQDKLKTRPHPFVMADEMYESLRSNRTSQSCLIKGLSGSGKTETAKLMVNYLSCIKSIDDLPHNQLPAYKKKRWDGALGTSTCPWQFPSDMSASNPSKILAAGLSVIDAFSCAKTGSNTNSSRVGKTTKLYFGDGPAVAGGSIHAFFLEKGRVTHQQENERGFHIFYQVILGATNAMKAKHKIKPLASYAAYLKPTRLQTINDELEFSETLKNLKLLNFSEDDIDFVLAVITAVLEIGLIEFEGGDQNASITKNSEAVVTNVEALLELPVGKLKPALLEKAIGTARGKTTTVSAKVEDAILGRDALARSLYGCLFDYVVDRVNSNLQSVSKNSMARALASSPQPTEPLSIAIIDPYGYESNDANGFENLCINYIDEKLEQALVKKFYKSEFDKYATEGLDNSMIDYKDNKNIADLLDKKPQGVLCMLDEACRYPRNTDKSFLQKLTTTHMRSRQNGSQLISKDKQANDSKFVVSHTCGETTYDTDGFLETNKDRLGAHLSELIAKASENSVISGFYSEEKLDASLEAGGFRSSSASSPNGTSVTVAKKLIEEMHKLCDIISGSSLSLVRCILPNQMHAEKKLDIKLLERQVKHGDLLSSVKMRQDGFSFKASYTEFYEQFIIVIPTGQDPSLVLVPKKGSDYKALCKNLIKALTKMALLSNVKDTIQEGDNCVFIKHKTIQAFEALRKVKLLDMDRAAVLLQATVRGMIANRGHDKLKKGVSRAQASWRAVYYRQLFRKQLEAIRVIQIRTRGYVQRKNYKDNLQASKTINNFYTKLKGRVRWHKLQQAVRSLHSLGRAYIVRMHVNRMLEAVQMLQHCARRFLKKNKVHYTKVKCALFLQGWYKGSKERDLIKEAVDYLDKKRKERFRARAVKKAQNRWKSLMIRRRYKQLVQASQTLQQYARAKKQRKVYTSMRKTATLLQSGFRGFKDRDRVREVRNAKMVQEEQQAVASANRNEALNLANLNARRAQGLAGGKSRNFRFDVLDVDILVAINDVYPVGWSKNVITLDEDVAKRGRRLKNIAVGAAHTAALTDTGEMFTWGWSDCGQLGHGSHQQEREYRPLETLMLQSDQIDDVVIDRAISNKLCVKVVSCGEDHTLALADTGKVFSWGSGRKGQLGHGDFKNTAFPRCIQNLKWITTQIECGSNHSVSIGHNGSLYSWGACMTMGGAKIPTTTWQHDAEKLSNCVNDKGDVSIPTNMKNVVPAKIRKVCCGAKFTLGLTYDGDVYSWGNNDFGQLGREGESIKPEIIEGLRLRRRHHAGIVSISCGARHSLAANNNGQVMAWGWNEFGTLGAGDTEEQQGIHLVLGDLQHHQVTQVSAGYRHSSALTADGDIFVWGMSALAARDGTGVPVIPSKEGSIAAGPSQKLHVSPLKIYRAGQALTQAIELHSSWSRCTSTLAVTIRSKTSDLPTNKNGSVDWSSYLLKKVNHILANGSRPEIDTDLRDESREFIVRLTQLSNALQAFKGKGFSTSPLPAPKIGREFSYTSTPTQSRKKSPGRQTVAPRYGPQMGQAAPELSKTGTPLNQTTPTKSKFTQKSTIITEKELREMKPNDLRTFAHQLKAGLVQVAPRHEDHIRGGNTHLTFAEEQYNYFRKNFRGTVSDLDDKQREAEEGWVYNYNQKDTPHAQAVKKAKIDVGRELKKKANAVKMMMAARKEKKAMPQELMSLKKKREEKARVADENQRRRKAEYLKLRKMKEGKKKIIDGAMLDYFRVEHLVAASNDNYTSTQVRTIYGRGNGIDTNKGKNLRVEGLTPRTDVVPPAPEDSPVRIMTRRMSGFALGDGPLMMSGGP
mmetsp:Transcript_11271/g.20421  ORF Transcript_11271/g.20421 Transcript_11271/m.20421 type:complete len:1946 (-) Transcript_11271:75-5912(-)|eukprot:CAMPEP_0182503932 /NCGR_PEP_ID=MMETSP1321-20130603/16272_1 /TAXON_ID=91990 /ORGANISM="Bolidomonas sp., Strain RCC1657" /LENGTH=1945 /DNA_ID=CAMNT_0024709185 /DNA_START=187 /DNA_END=6024 /DNA_ORIENTATION=+